MTPIEPISEKMLASTSEERNGIEAKKFTPVQQQCDALEIFRLLATLPTIEDKAECAISSAATMSETAELSRLPEQSPATYIPIEPAVVDRLSQTLWSLCVSIERLQDDTQTGEAEKDRLVRLSRLAQAAYDEVHQVLVRLEE